MSSQIKKTHNRTHQVCQRVLTHEFCVGSDNGTTDSDSDLEEIIGDNDN
jgi:hypothetical protein